MKNTKPNFPIERILGARGQQIPSTLTKSQEFLHLIVGSPEINGNIFFSINSDIYLLFMLA